MYEKEILNFCNNIYCLRKNNHFSKAEMCRRIKVSIKTLSLLENGIIPPKISCEIIFNVSKEFNIKPKELFEPME